MVLFSSSFGEGNVTKDTVYIRGASGRSYSAFGGRAGRPAGQPSRMPGATSMSRRLALAGGLRQGKARDGRDHEAGKKLHSGYVAVIEGMG